MARKGHKSSKRYSVSLSEREGRLLQLYADSHDWTKPQALRHIIKGQLRQYCTTAANATAENQLELFDSVQIDIFNHHTKVNDSNN
ncbi:MAG: hypothetical protein K5650_05675 [Bacteroidales bacterium]|nr:hypothetical protein [Bacteroidales bacterium]